MMEYHQLVESLEEARMQVARFDVMKRRAEQNVLLLQEAVLVAESGGPVKKPELLTET